MWIILSVSKFEHLGMCLLLGHQVYSPAGLHWKACQQGVQIFWCSPGKHLLSEKQNHMMNVN